MGGGLGEGGGRAGSARLGGSHRRVARDGGGAVGLDEGGRGSGGGGARGRGDGSRGGRAGAVGHGLVGDGLDGEGVRPLEDGGVRSQDDLEAVRLLVAERGVDVPDVAADLGVDASCCCGVSTQILDVMRRCGVTYWQQCQSPAGERESRLRSGQS